MRKRWIFPHTWKELLEFATDAERELKEKAASRIQRLWKVLRTERGSNALNEVFPHDDVSQVPVASSEPAFLGGREGGGARQVVRFRSSDGRALGGFVGAQGGADRGPQSGRDYQKA